MNSVGGKCNSRVSLFTVVVVVVGGRPEKKNKLLFSFFGFETYAKPKNLSFLFARWFLSFLVSKLPRSQKTKASPNLLGF